jgi:hypothetical protein
LKSTSFTPDSSPQSYLSTPDLSSPSEIRTFRCYEGTAHKLRPSPFGIHLRSPESAILLPELNKPVQNHENPFNLNEVNPRHPRATFYQRLMVSFEQERRVHIDFNGDNVGTYDPYLDDVFMGNDTDSEDEMKARPPIKRKVPNPGGVRWSEEETQSYKEGWDDRDNDPNSYAYDDYGQGYVSFSNDHFAHINDEQHVALTSSLCSLISNVEHLNIMPHSVNCAKCVKKNKDQIDLLADSSASLHFTN